VAAVILGHCKFDANPLSVDVTVHSDEMTPIRLLVTREDIERVQIRVNEDARIHVRVPHGYRGDLNLNCVGHLDAEVRSWDFGAVAITCDGTGVLKLGRLRRLTNMQIDSFGTVTVLRETVE